ncbi:MAG: hypothetical protein Q9210_002828 [Variospora velana]
MSIPRLSLPNLRGRILPFTLSTLLILTVSRAFSDSKNDVSELAAVGSQVSTNDSRAFSVSAGLLDSVTLLPYHQGPSAASSPVLVKRDPKADFQRSKAHGDDAHNAIQRFFTRTVLHECDPLPIRNFRPEDFRNGWSGEDGNSLPLGGPWGTVFEKVLGKKPTKEQSFMIEVRQDRPFINNLGNEAIRARLQPGETWASYKQYYIPAISAIIADHNRGPITWVRTRFLRARQQPPSNQEIFDRLVPPLSRWSDVTWTLWKQKAGNGAGNLRYVARSANTNEDTKSVMSYIYDKHGGAKPFPGLEFGMDTGEGRALLGTPSGVGMAWLLIERMDELGRRNPRVKIFKVGNGFFMLWDLVPVG